MSNFAISAENVAKRYKIGGPAGELKNIRESITNAVTAPFRKIRSAWRSNPADSEAERATEFWALKDVSFQVAHGEVVGIIGRNGAGKSTLLKILSRITSPTLGRIRIRGRVGSLLEVGSGFHPELTGRDNIFLNGAILGMTKAEIRGKFDEIVAFSEVEKFIDTPVKRYSSGMYLRLAFAVAAHMEPEILMVDEVLAVGDAAFQQKCVSKIREVAHGGRTVLFVSHNMGVVTALCERAIHLADGKVKAAGPAREIVQNYLVQRSSGEVIDLQRLRLSGYGQHIRFTHLDMAENKSVPFREPLRFRLTIQSDLDFEGLSIGSTISNALEVPVGTLHSRDSFDIRAGETLELLLTIDNLVLAPASYRPGFSIGRGGGSTSRQDLDVVIGEPAFEVLPVANSGLNNSQWRADLWGNVVMSSNSLEIITHQ